MVQIPRLAIASLGGTIAMKIGPDGAAIPALSGDDLVQAIPQLRNLATVTVQAIANVGSPSLTFQHILKAVEWAREQCKSGASGAIITQGTDTLEESSYLADLIWDCPQPLIFTGAMRSAGDPGADGPANLWASALTALSPQARDLGVLTVFNEEVHLARRVMKQHSTALSTFHSPASGPIAYLEEDEVVPFWQPPAQRTVPLPVPDTYNMRVPILEVGLGQDYETLAALGQSGIHGIVLAALGSGHVPQDWPDTVEELATRIPVIITSRTGAGSTTRHTYGYPGAELDLLKRGVELGGHLSARKARILLWAILSGAHKDDWRQQFALRAQTP
ncbi:MAG: asparaginase [Actinomycetaceae bacterium]|nr:asparaginase [Actinomycetaceae bacterium]